MARALQVPDQEYLSILNDFLKRRPAALRTLVARHLADAESYRCSVTMPAGTRVSIDGHPPVDRFEGWYFKGQTIRVDVSENPDAFAYWRVNGVVTGQGLTLTDLPVHGDLQIEAVYQR